MPGRLPPATPSSGALTASSEANAAAGAQGGALSLANPFGRCSAWRPCSGSMSDAVVRIAGISKSLRPQPILRGSA
jgi:hypothetical protein